MKKYMKNKTFQKHQTDSQTWKGFFCQFAFYCHCINFESQYWHIQLLANEQNLKF